MQKFLHPHMKIFPHMNFFFFFKKFFFSKIAYFDQQSIPYKIVTVRLKTMHVLPFWEKMFSQKFLHLQKFLPENAQIWVFLVLAQTKISGRNFCSMSEISAKKNISILYLYHMSDLEKSIHNSKIHIVLNFFFIFQKPDLFFKIFVFFWIFEYLLFFIKLRENMPILVYICAWNLFFTYFCIIKNPFEYYFLV